MTKPPAVAALPAGLTDVLYLAATGSAQEFWDALADILTAHERTVRKQDAESVTGNTQTTDDLNELCAKLTERIAPIWHEGEGHMRAVHAVIPLILAERHKTAQAERRLQWDQDALDRIQYLAELWRHTPDRKHAAEELLNALDESGR